MGQQKKKKGKDRQAEGTISKNQAGDRGDPRESIKMDSQTRSQETKRIRAFRGEEKVAVIIVVSMEPCRACLSTTSS
jgi:hypothetical protein